MKKILVTGGCGYIGSHTTVDLIENGFEVVSIDNNSRSNEAILDGVYKITGKKIKNYKINVCDLQATRKVFEENKDIIGLIDFAAYKSVPESVKEPLLYYHNNLNSLINVLFCIKEYNIFHFVFSSSCSVYGNVTKLPVTEDTPLSKSESPYATTKKMGEEIIADYCKAEKTNCIALRYFNPVGAHESALIGEVPYGKPDNLVPAITQTGIGKMQELVVHGCDYTTRDKTCVRDYVHVMDIAHAHTLALQYMIDGRNESNFEIINLGSGNGVTVLEAINAWEKVSGKKLNYKLGSRREGDVEAIYADTTKAKEKLNWVPKRDTDTMMSSAWKWELKMQESNS